MASIAQNIFSRNESFPERINFRRVSHRQAGDAVRHLTNQKVASSSLLTIGVAYHVSNTGKLDFISLANTDTAFRIDFDMKVDGIDKDFFTLLSATDDALSDDRPRCLLVGFSMARTAVQVHQTTRRRLKGVDLSTLYTPATWKPHSAMEVVDRVSRSANKWEVARLWVGNEHSMEKNICLQAWLAACVGSRSLTKLDNALKVDTSFLNLLELDLLAQMVAQADLIDSHKPKEAPNDFSKVTLNKFGQVEVVNARYKTRIRRSESVLIMTRKDGYEYVGNAHGSKGKQTTIRMHGKNHNLGEIQSIRVVGRQELTNPEKAREEFLHLLLTGRKNLRDSPFIRTLWFPKWKATNCPFRTVALDLLTADRMTAEMKLNESQRHVVRGMVGDMPVVVAHGPPGTGKTTTIAAASRIWDLHGHSVWIAAHSNVAVKNIAETLYKKGVDFKLLISKDFFVEWHEHLYAEILQRIIRSDDLPGDVREMERVVGDSCIILCTLSMLSNPALQDNGTFDLVPVERLIIDEASQINTFEFLHIFERFQETLEKVCFFGDPNQLPPFGQEKVPTIRTIFDLQHITNSNRDFFLDTQYRMPVPVGSFISEQIYGGRLQSEHVIKDTHCVAFIDVGPPRGQEGKVGFSWKNEAEIKSIVHLVRYYYQGRNFCVITPYDAQRAAIETALKSENLPWNSVYNLDSFQGEEYFSFFEEFVAIKLLYLKEMKQIMCLYQWSGLKPSLDSSCRLTG
ncbi:P-loop containing nucleoside triphosphate hydrolase protein [Flammula alnicola]|nr:P-loop containing nucleoside triphosphate hydrolase protein [Flammula alnicola]